MKTSPLILWFRQDLRLQHHPAFEVAKATGLPILPLYILDDDTPGPWKMGAAQRWWLHHSLLSLNKDLDAQGGKLILRRGSPSRVLQDVLQETGAQSIYWSRCYEPFSIVRDTGLKKDFIEQGITIKSFNSSLLFEPWEIKNQQGQPYKIFTQFWKKCLAQGPRFSIFENTTLAQFYTHLKSEDLTTWELTPTHPNWAHGFSELWQPGEDGAHQKLEIFFTHHLKEYKETRNRPGYYGTSRLSPHLHFGEISPHQIWRCFQQLTNSPPSSESYLAEIGWREFCYHLLYAFPSLPERPFQKKFTDFQWKNNNDTLKAWQQGNTGYPIVDAGMRELWHTGWMHNRVRMIVASFLTKHLLLSWQEGEKWFWNTLVDADLANNAANWQWIAGCGADAAPYFRIFNPTLQGEKFDPQGDYVRRWVPELKNLSNSFIHKPWQASAAELNQAGVILGKTYPLPLVNHGDARDRALESYRQL
ncbi:deoxyribodipyrimidine photolyase [Candidatus Paracaedimonas acanthamoebae]|nr:deoxyribodipyrimidine photolyase [Candidatus Paracaedimonas acanthamoebae]